MHRWASAQRLKRRHASSSFLLQQGHTSPAKPPHKRTTRQTGQSQRADTGACYWFGGCESAMRDTFGHVESKQTRTAVRVHQDCNGIGGWASRAPRRTRGSKIGPSRKPVARASRSIPSRAALAENTTTALLRLFIRTRGRQRPPGRTGSRDRLRAPPRTSTS